MLIVTITLASASGKYSADGYCWLSVQDGVIWGFAGPVIFIIMVRKLKTHSFVGVRTVNFIFAIRQSMVFFACFYFQLCICVCVLVQFDNKVS